MTNTAQHLVYGLIDPRTNELRYVGKSSTGMKRPHKHLHPWERRGNTHKAKWLRNLYADGGLVPSILVLRECADNEEALRSEIELIAMFRQAGFRLTNLTAGGEGMLGLTPWNKGRTGYAQSADHVAKRAAALRGRPLPEATREKLSLARTGRPSPRLGVKLSAETRARMSAAAMGKRTGPLSAETKARIGAAVRLAAERRRQMKAAQETQNVA